MANINFQVKCQGILITYKTEKGFPVLPCKETNDKITEIVKGHIQLIARDIEVILEKEGAQFEMDFYRGTQN